MDFIRFIAAMLIVLGHGFAVWNSYYRSPGPPSLIMTYVDEFIANAALGVELFFFISGFLITYILLREKEMMGKISIGKFFARRALRIWPLYFLLIAITPMLVTWLDVDTPNYMANIFFVGNFDVIGSERWHFPFAHFWSIAIEEQFYVVWPFVIAFLPKKSLAYVFGALITVSILSRLYVWHFCPNSWNIYLNTICRMDTLVIGGACGLAFQRGAKFQLKWGLLLVTFGFLIFMLVTSNSKSWQGMYDSMFKKFLYLAPMALLTLHYITRPRLKEESKVKKAFNYLGKSSYGLYMIHNILILIVLKEIMLANDMNDGTIFWLIYLGLTFITVIISFELVEKPFLRLKKYFTVLKTRKF